VAVVSCSIANGEFSSMPLPGLDSEFEIPYNIITNGFADSGGTIEQSGCLHARFTSHPDNIFATLRRISCRRDPKSHWTRAVWRAVEHYSSVPLTEKEEEQAVNPLDRAAYIDWVSTPYQVPILMGAVTSGSLETIEPIVNSAGDTPDPVPEKTEYYWVANVVKNVTTIPSWVLTGEYAGSVNIAPFLIEGATVEAECARLIDLRVSKKMKENDVRFRQLSFSLEFRARREQRNNEDGSLMTSDDPPPPFNLELPDIGLHGLDKSNIPFVRTKFMTDDTPPRSVSQPVLMDGAGGKLDDPSPYTMILKNWRIMRKKDFTVLPLI
jgi:hypothetical protein